MRYLSKIIFINSASIRYAEIKLDGNVHLIGTQGVGKSTLLRAILFFYNADKQRLGIPREKKSFDEFYLPQSNSYIVYEVQTEHGAFCILTFRHLGRAAFRIIDAPYAQRWFVDEDGAVTSESPIIRSRLGGRYMSRIIEHYDEMRDILYGNKGAIAKEFTRFNLCESQRYSSIPRSITNVFLNSKVDAEFIKDIIIRSLSEEEPGIDLGYYRRQMSEFEQELGDIGLWFKADKQGRVPIRQKAAEIVDLYHRRLYLGSQLQEDAAEIRDALQAAQERIPLLEEALTGLLEKETRQRRLLGELSEKHDKEKSLLLRELGVLEDRLKTITRKRKFYEGQGISEVLERYSKEGVLRGELSEKKRQHDILTSASEDIKMKYERLEVNIRAGQQRFYETQQREIDALRQERDKQIDALRQVFDRKTAALRRDSSDEIGALQAGIGALKLEKRDAENSLKSLPLLHPCEEQIAAATAQLQALRLEEAGLASEVKALAAKEDGMRSAMSLSKHLEDLKEALAAARKALEEHLADTGFEHSLAQVLDEERIRREIASLEEELSVTRSDLKTVREIHERKAQMEVRLSVLPRKCKELKLKQEELAAQEKAIVAERQKALEDALGLAAQRLAEKEAALKALESKLESSLKAAEKDHSSQRDAVKKETGARIAEREASIKEHFEQMKTRLSELELQKKEDLRGRGVDMTALGELETAIGALEAELRFIEDRRELVFAFNKDKAELFDFEENTRSEKKALEARIAALEQKFALRRSADESRLSEILSAIETNRRETASLREDVRKTTDFLSTNAALADDGFVQTRVTRECTKIALRSCGELLEEMRSALLEDQKAAGLLRQGVNLFRSFLSGANTFKFRTELIVDKDFMEFASGLSEFILNDKIEDYRLRVSERYVEILGRISREMGDVTRGGSDVEKTIREINYDFRERNFVGAIKSIELRSVESSDILVQLLLKIKEFTDEHQFAMGEANLFNENAADVNRQAVGHLLELSKQLQRDPSRTALTLSDTFTLQFRIVENNNDTLWVEKISNVGSDGTDVLVKAMVNIMLINVFKEKVAKRTGDFRIHCMMDEIGKLHPSNVKGILEFANSRNILLVNGSPTTYNVAEYRHTYLLSKDSDSVTVVRPLITRRDDALHV